MVREFSPHVDLGCVIDRGFLEVAQQTKARKKEDFVHAFSPVLAEATAAAYKGATSDVQNKLRRVVQVWRERHIFDQPIQDAIEARLQGTNITHL
jgi:regulator of Ty1 transposition protein 103